MKVAVIGSGIAGLATARLLQREGIEVKVYERQKQMPAQGYAFMMHSEGLEILESITGRSLKDIPGKYVNTYLQKDQKNQVEKYIKLDPWQCIKRSDLIESLADSLLPDTIEYDKSFHSFVYEGNIARSVLFDDGTGARADIFIGADGARSAVRESMFGKTKFSPTLVKELVGLVKTPEILKGREGIFHKYRNTSEGISVGFISCSDDEMVWFVQFDCKRHPLDKEDESGRKEFCEKICQYFPTDIRAIVDAGCYENSYVWYSRDFDLLPIFHKNNVVLAGDAAHLALPFTSAGTTNALKDAKILAAEILNQTIAEKAFIKFYEIRHENLDNHLKLGRRLQYDFLNPRDSDLMDIPLITGRNIVKDAPHKPVELLYFTDPVCSTCWMIQPHLRKFRLKYGKYIRVKYHMGGLLPSWVNYNRGGIRTPEDAAEYWERAARTYEMPISGDIWRSDPLDSSFPPSIAFKAAQIQDVDKAIIFLRRINELLFVENINISYPEVLTEAAFEVGFDAARFSRDLYGKAREEFESDLELSSRYEIRSLPTFIFLNNRGEMKRLQGFKDFKELELAFLEIYPGAKGDSVEYDPRGLFKIYPTLMTEEFAFLMDIDKAEAFIKLEEMKNHGFLAVKEGKRGLIWGLKTTYVA